MSSSVAYSTETASITAGQASFRMLQRRHRRVCGFARCAPAACRGMAGVVRAGRVRKCLPQCGVDASLVAASRQDPAPVGPDCSPAVRASERCGGAHTSHTTEANAQAWAHARRPKPCQLTIHPLLQHIVAVKLMCEWSPEQWTPVIGGAG